MNHCKISACLIAIAAYCMALNGGALKLGLAVGAQHSAKNEASGSQFDPLKCLTSSFPSSVSVKRKGHLLEFCPDNTCHGFVSSANVSAVALKDFAYLYIYFFSDYVYLPDWRNHPDAKVAAERVLSKLEYRHCKAENDRETARCVLLDLSRGGKIKLIFVRYDENRRNVVPEDVAEELSKTQPSH